MFVREKLTSQCQKLLFSATLTRDPAKVAQLNLTAPEYYIVSSTRSITQIGQAFELPSSLTERSIILPPHLKPLNLLHLLHTVGSTPSIVFTKSVDNATRLVKLLTYFEQAYIGGRKLSVASFTRDMKVGERKAILADFAGGKLDVLVCSDLISRGIDLPSVEHVVSYDVPLDMTKYVHRAGRTARAGRDGTVWTMVEKQEAKHFKDMLAGAGKKVRKVKIKEEQLEGFKESYDIAMKRLRDDYGRD